MAISKKVAIATKNIQTAKLTYVKLTDIHEPVGLNGGDEDVTRWDLDVPKVRKAFDELVDSILSNGFIATIVAVQLPINVTLYGTKYKKDDWLAVDVNGRVLVLKDLVKQGFVLNKNDKELEGKVPVGDVTHLVIPDDVNTINEDIIEKLWETLVKLNTGQLQWTDYDFISTGSRAITNTEQKEIWSYLASTMKTYHNNKITNKVVLGATIHELTNKEKRTAKINFDMRFKRYSDDILKVILMLRTTFGTQYCKAPFLTMLAKHFRKAAMTGKFEGMNFDRDGKPIMKSLKQCFTINSDLYEDEHYFEFKKYLEFLGNRLDNCDPPREGFPGGTVMFKIFINEFVLRAREHYDRKVL